ncbi:hypothetical protein F8388_009119 [Cannabis sativa]|uniref:Ubiquitin-like domain-containing protein n=1 Tax=Cannabis sativa TaxID=3483 RepID=A0A7J6FA00_CANSA|nr:hypothetical protein G4B88_003706 [Cannabis sativa]KAF4383088.1 hypothetical protein F8388_009119 [Cannabis sativa]
MSATGGGAGGGGGGGGQEEDKKPVDQTAHINLKVKGQAVWMSRNRGKFRLRSWYNGGGSGVSSWTIWLGWLAKDGNEVFFRIKRSTQLRKLMTAYCDRQSVELNSIAFLFDGRRLRVDQTPDELEMEDGDEIDAMLHQTGGSP